MDPDPRPESASLASARDAGLSLLGRLRRWLVVATLALIGILAGLVAQAKPGKSSRLCRGAGGGTEFRARGLGGRSRRRQRWHPRRASRRQRSHRSQRLPPPLPPRRWSRAGHEPDRLAVVRRAGNDRVSLRHSGERTGSSPPCPRGGARGDRPRLQPVSRRTRSSRDSTARRAVPFAPAGCSSRRSPWRSVPPRRPTASVDPTIGRALRAIGYDRDFAAIAKASNQPIRVRAAVVGGWRSCDWISGRRIVQLPRGVELDLGATAKALAADRAARRAHDAVGGGVLVNLGGDLSIAGARPSGLAGPGHRRPCCPGARPRPDRARLQRGPGDIEHDRAPLGHERRRCPPHRGPCHGRLRRRGLAHGERGRRLLPRCQCRQHRGDRPRRVGSRLARRARAPSRLVGPEGRVVRVGGWPEEALA